MFKRQDLQNGTLVLRVRCDRRSSLRLYDLEELMAGWRLTVDDTMRVKHVFNGIDGGSTSIAPWTPRLRASTSCFPKRETRGGVRQVFQNSPATLRYSRPRLINPDGNLLYPVAMQELKRASAWGRRCLCRRCVPLPRQWPEGAPGRATCRKSERICVGRN